MEIKLDMENIFDRVEHEFLFKVMQKFDLKHKLLSWNGSCIYNPWISHLLNKISTPFFRASIGLIQGFPLSPLLYVLMEKSLNKRLEWECANGTISGIKIAQGVNQINHSQFTNDTILLSGPSKFMSIRIKQVLDIFLSASGGLLNKIKIQIYVWNVSSHSNLGISQILGFAISIDWKTFKYLGLPMCLKSLPGEYWQIILQNLEKRWILGDKVAQPSWVFGSNKISFILSTPLPILLPPSSQGCLEIHGSTHSQISMARRKFQHQKDSFSQLEYHLLS
jgi:hypothetical protein